MKDAFSPEKPLVLVGCGHMGHAMAVGWLKAGLDPAALHVVDPHAAAGAVPPLSEVHLHGALEQLERGLMPRAIILAVKPQIIDGVLPLLAPLVSSETLVVSIAAGVTLDQMARGIDAEAVLVRAMPNTPAAVGAGISGLTAGDDISEGHKELARVLLTAMGPTVWLEHEDMMNAVTAVSGSGPAYVFHLVECMAAAGTREGLPEDIAMQLARQTVIGAARLMDVEEGVSAADLRRRVTSPGGTTAAALAVLMHEGAMPALMLDAVKAARMKGEELAG